MAYAAYSANAFDVSRDCHPPAEFGCVPVEESDVRRDVVGKQLVDHAAIVVEAFFVWRSLAVGEDARPGHRHPVAAHAEGLKQLHVLFVQVVGVVGHVASVAIVGIARRVRKDIPQRWTAPVVFCAAFNLGMPRLRNPQDPWDSADSSPQAEGGRTQSLEKKLGKAAATEAAAALPNERRVKPFI